MTFWIPGYPPPVRPEARRTHRPAPRHSLHTLRTGSARSPWRLQETPAAPPPRSIHQCEAEPRAHIRFGQKAIEPIPRRHSACNATAHILCNSKIDRNWPAWLVWEHSAAVKFRPSFPAMTMSESLPTVDQRWHLPAKARAPDALVEQSIGWPEPPFPGQTYLSRRTGTPRSRTPDRRLRADPQPAPISSDHLRRPPTGLPGSGAPAARRTPKHAGYLITSRAHRRWDWPMHFKFPSRPANFVDALAGDRGCAAATSRNLVKALATSASGV